MRLLVPFLLLGLTLSAETPIISRPARPWQFFDAIGQKAAILGREDGTIEGWVYPLKLFRDLKLRFIVDGHVIPAEAIARQTTARPGSFRIAYSGDEFRAAETFITPMNMPGSLIRLEIDARSPVEVQVAFTRDFQLMWPASMGTAWAQWHESPPEMLFGADGEKYRGLLALPGGKLLHNDYESNYSGSPDAVVSLGTMQGHAERVLAMAASLASQPDAEKIAADLTARAGDWEKETDADFAQYLDRTVSISVPDQQIQSAYDWARISLRKMLADNPLLGKGLMAGIGGSKGAYRPGYGWFFGRDSFWCSLALTAEGDYQTSRDAIAFISHFQRADGKIPHEISQSASLTQWFDKYPWAYSSADGTPFFVIALEDYVSGSGDDAFLREQWDHARKAMEFWRSTLAPDGWPKNQGVGHGWVEGGPLLPVQTEFYLAGAGVEALRAMSVLAHRMGDAAMAQQLSTEYQTRKAEMEKRFWMAREGRYAFAIGVDGKLADKATVLGTVPMWFGLTDMAHSRTMIEQLAREDHASDWGMRIISRSDPLYSPAGYHFGSVWPLFTGWAAVGEYRYRAPWAALGNLEANAFLELDGGSGTMTEVLSGETYSELSTSSPHQAWSSAMLISPVLRGMFGLESQAGTVRLAPQTPVEWTSWSLRNVQGVDFFYENGSLRAVNHSSKPVALTWAPSFAPIAKVTHASLPFKRIDNPSDWQAVFETTLPVGETRITVDAERTFGYRVETAPPQLAQASDNLKVIAERWPDGACDLTVSGRPGRTYRIRLAGSVKPVHVDGGTLQGNELIVEWPGDRAGDYETKEVRLRF
jgi:hypothetical protein